MEVIDATSIGRDLLVMCLWLVAPVVIVSLFVGMFVSILQTITSVQEQTLSFAPRIVAVVATMVFLTPWYLTMLKNYTSKVFEQMLELL